MNRASPAPVAEAPVPTVLEPAVTEHIASAHAPSEVPAVAAPPVSVMEERFAETATTPSSPQPVHVADEIVREERPSAQPAVKPMLEFDWQSDLTQIETDRVKLHAAQARAEEEPAPPARKRERRLPPPVSDEPLIQVETKDVAPAPQGMPVHEAAKEETVSKAVTG